MTGFDDEQSVRLVVSFSVSIRREKILTRVFHNMIIIISFIWGVRYKRRWL